MMASSTHRPLQSLTRQECLLLTRVQRGKGGTQRGSGSLGVTGSQGHRDTETGHWAPRRGAPEPLLRLRRPVRGEAGVAAPLACFPGEAACPRPQRSWEPGGSQRGAGSAAKGPPAPGTLTSCARSSARGELAPPRVSLRPRPAGCAGRMRCLRVNRACFPFTPSGSVFMKNFLLLALWEYSFLACAARVTVGLGNAPVA